MMMEQQQQQLSQHHQQPGHISLSVLIDMIIQRTYHELTILAGTIDYVTHITIYEEYFSP